MAIIGLTKGRSWTIDLDGFNRKMEKLIRDCYKTVKTGGHVALPIQNTTEPGEDIEQLGRYYADHVFDCYGFFIKVALQGKLALENALPGTSPYPRNVGNGTPHAVGRDQRSRFESGDQRELGQTSLKLRYQ